MTKIIHYCWFGDKPLPNLAKKCIKSWKKYLPGYKIMCWSEENFDVNSTPFSKDAYENGKWAFVSDVARAYALKEYGGIYMDTDMMITKDVSEIVKSGFFAGWETDINVAVGVLGVKDKHHPVIEELYDYYSKTRLNLEDLFTQSIPRLLTGILRKKYNLANDHLNNQYLDDGIVIYARDYFYPISSDESPDMFTENTCMIHYYMGSWLPRSQRIRNRVHEMLGKRYGDAFLDAAVSMKQAGKKTGRFVLFPLVKVRRDKIMEKDRTSRMQKYGKIIDSLPKSDYLVVYNPEWPGKTNATNGMFQNTVGIDEFAEQEIADFLADKIIERKYKVLVFSSFALGWEKLVKAVRERSNEIVIKVLWHGSDSRNVEIYYWENFRQIFYLLDRGLINSIGFLKKSMYEFYKTKGYHVEFVMNTFALGKNDVKIGKNHEHTGKRIGIYAPGDKWEKNLYNQLCAASMLDDVRVECIPITMQTQLFADIIKVEVEGAGKQLPREELFAKMASNDLNLYVTFSECAPLIPLESFEMGVPCITGNNHHYWEGTELADYIVVNEADNIMKIYEKMEKCFANKEKVLQLYREWKEKYDVEAKESVARFLETGGQR